MVKTDKMVHLDHECDLCIIGGGLTGLCAAVAAAREGIRVLLMQDRPMLGGNASSEIRMWVRGARGLCNRETGIISELEQENIYRNPRLNYSLWDGVMWEKVKAEKNIELLLNCSCCDAETVEKDGKSRIVSVTGWQLTTYTWHSVKAKYFADCSGDSVLATLSGAKWRVGREGHNEYNETIGPVTGDRKTMGMSCLLQARETDHTVDFIPPEWAYTFETDEDFNRIEVSPDTGEAITDAGDSVAERKIRVKTTMNRPHTLGTSLTNFWWIEMGGERDSIHDAEEMRDELLKIAYGIWDHVKNRGDHKKENANWDIEWIGFLPGKRESRRYIGAYVMNEKDILAGGKFDDVIAFGGWPMDDHNPAGFRSYLESNPASVLHPAPSPYGIPYRVLYSDDVENLFFAGRNISVTHAALSSTRVMATCALLGQAMGNAAAICVNDEETPAGVYEHKIGKLQAKLMDQGCMIPGKVRDIPALSKNAKLNLSDEDRLLLFNGHERPDEKGNVNYVTLPVGGEITFDFGNFAKLHELRLMFDPDFSRESVSVNKKMRVFAQRSSIGKDFRPMKVAKTLVRSFEVFADGKLIFSDDKNHIALRRLPLDVTAKTITARFNSTWGEDSVHIFSADVR